jgi:hypothetical protein
MSKLLDISTVLAATAGLWALGFGWFTYVSSVLSHNQDEFLALKSIVEGLRVELGLMKPWTGAGGSGYSKKMTLQQAPPEWSQPSRLIWKFSSDAIENLSSSPYVYRLRDIVGPFARLDFSISRLFQLYDEYRAFANTNPGVFASPPPWYTTVILDFNFRMHVNLIGGSDSDDPTCLYKAYDDAISALGKFDADLKSRPLPWWFRFGHFVGFLCFAFGILLLFRLFRP